MITYKNENVVLDSNDISMWDVDKVGTTKEFGVDYVKDSLLYGLCLPVHTKSVAYLRYHAVKVLKWDFTPFPLGHELSLLDYINTIDNMYAYIHEREKQIKWFEHEEIEKHIKFLRIDLL